MSRVRFSHFLLLIYFLLSAPYTGAEETGPSDPWRLFTTNSTRFEWYDNKGNESASPYQHEGGQFNNDFLVNLNRRPSEYESVDLSFNGSYNDSLYRGKRGLFLEGASVLWEKGDAPMPFRMTAGDFFAFQTDRTIQRSLKGALLEIQPPSGLGRAFHSLQFFTGFSAPAYYDIEAGSDYYNGGSWLIEDERVGSFLLSLTHNYRRKDNSLSLARRNQRTMSIAFEREFAFSGQQAALNTEIVNFSGQAPDATEQDKDEKTDNGFYAAVNGRSRTLPLTYYASFEQYGKDFEPAGAVSGTDERRYEGRTGWSFTGGNRVEGRLQRYETARESGNMSDTNTYGLRLTGPLFREKVPGATLYVDSFISVTGNETGDVDTEARAVQGSVNLPVATGLSSQIGASHRKIENKTRQQVMNDEQLTLSVVKQFSRDKLKGSIAPGWTIRHATGPSSDQDAHYPAIAVNLSHGNHRVQLSHGVTFQDTHENNGTDVVSERSSINYTFTKDRHNINLYADRFKRDPQPGDDTWAYRTGIFYTVSLERIINPRTTAVREEAAQAAPEAEMLTVLSLPPGIHLDEAGKILRSSGAAGPWSQGDYSIYEVPVFARISERQRLVLEHEDGTVNRTWLIIDGDRTVNVTNLMRNFENIRSELARGLGQPSYLEEKGEFRPSIFEDVASGQFVRVVEWKTRQGFVRLGIPERLDGLLRIEVVYSEKQVTPLSNPQWGIEQIQ